MLYHADILNLRDIRRWMNKNRPLNVHYRVQNFTGIHNQHIGVSNLGGLSMPPPPPPICVSINSWSRIRISLALFEGSSQSQSNLPKLSSTWNYSETFRSNHVEGGGAPPCYFFLNTPLHTYHFLSNNEVHLQTYANSDLITLKNIYAFYYFYYYESVHEMPNLIQQIGK